MLEVLEEPEQHHHEGQTHAHDAMEHRLVDDISLAVTGLLVHHVLVGWQRGQGQCREGVHDEIHPQHLGDGQGRLGAEDGSDQHDEACCHVDGHLEQDETLDVMVQRASPGDGTGDALERVVEDGDVAGFLGHAGAVAHREAYLGCIQGRRVVGAVAGHRHHLAFLLQ